MLLLKLKHAILLTTFSIFPFIHSADAAFTVTPGTVVGFDATSSQLHEYSFAGSLTETLYISGLPQTSVGVAILGNRVFVGDVAGNVGEVNLSTGAVFNLFNNGGNEALGDNGTNLLTYNFITGTVSEYTTTGTHLNTIALASGNGGTGIDGFGSRTFVGQHTGNGNIREFDAAGGLVNTVITGLPGGSVSGLGYDPTDGSFWISTGFGDDRIRHFSSTGTLLANFAAGSSWINGLDVVPVPEPTTLALACLGLSFIAMRRKR